MGTSVLERTREFGIMRTIGGRSRTILRNVISEGVFIGLLSFVHRGCFIATPLSIGGQSYWHSSVSFTAFAGSVTTGFSSLVRTHRAWLRGCKCLSSLDSLTFDDS